MKSKFKYFFIIFLIFLFSLPLLSEEPFSKEASKNNDITLPYYNKYYDQKTSFDSKIDAKKMEKISEGPVKKLGRGICNIVFGVFEIFIEPYEVNEHEGGAAALTYGVIKGLFYFIAREAVGVVEIITFPFPLPGASTSGFSDEWGYGPLMQPEWVFDLSRNPYNFIYHDDPL